MKKGQIAEGIVEKVVFPNKGIVAYLRIYFFDLLSIVYNTVFRLFIH